MGFASAARPQLYQVIVFLDERHKAEQIMELFLLRQLIRLIPGRTKHQVNPFITGEIGTRFLDLVQIQIGHLNWLER